MKYALIWISIFSFLSVSIADEIAVINVRRNIQLSETDPVYKDFYIDGGESAGLKKNMVVQAMRKMSVRDASGVHSYGDISIPVGQLKVIAVFPKLAIAREYKLLSRNDLPMLEQLGIMTGDWIEMKGNFIDRKPMSVTPPPTAVTALTTTETTIVESSTPTVSAPITTPPKATEPESKPNSPTPTGNNP